MAQQITIITILLVILQLEEFIHSQPVTRAPTDECSSALDYFDARSGNNYVVCDVCNTGY